MNMIPVSDNNSTTVFMNNMITTPDTNLANSILHRTTTDEAYTTPNANNQRYHLDSSVASSTMESGDDISITIHAPEIGPIITDTSTLPSESAESDVFLQTPISPFTDDEGLDNITISIDGDIDDQDAENNIDTSSELDSTDLNFHDPSLMDADYSSRLGVGASEDPSSSLGIGLSRRRKGKMPAGLRSASSASLSSVTSPPRQEELQAASKIVCPPPSPGISFTSIQTPNGSRRPIVPHQIANATTSSAYGVNVNVASTSAETGGSSSSNRSGSGMLLPVPVESSSSHLAQGTSTATSLLVPSATSTASSMSLSQQFLTPAAAIAAPAPPSSHDAPASSTSAAPSSPPPPPPITRIPVELLGEIFSHYVQGADPKPRWRTADRPDTGRFDATPLLLGRICRYWRMVSLLMPSLWSEITIRKPEERHVRLTAIWLQRSGRHPLTLTLQQQAVSKLRPGVAGGATATMQQGEPAELDGGGRMSALIREKNRREEEKVTIEIMKLFLRHIERWQDVNFAFVGKLGSPLISLLTGSIRSPLSPNSLITDGATPSTLTIQPGSSTTSEDEEESFYDESTNTIGGIRPGSASVLRSACVSLQGWDMQSVNSLWRRLYASPTLTMVDWIDGYKTTLPPNVPWEQLTSVNLGRNVDIDSAMFDVLPKCKNLRQLSLSRLKVARRDGVQNVAAAHVATPLANGPTAPPNSNSRTDPEPLFLPLLQSLTIKIYDPKIAQLLDLLILPSLTKLEIFQSSTERLPNVQSILDLVKRSKCKLTYLAVMDSSTGEEELLKLIGMSEVQNYLKELEIWAPMTDRVMQALTLDWVNAEIDSQFEGIDVRSSRWKGKRKCSGWLTDGMPVQVEGDRSNDADSRSDRSNLNSPSCMPLSTPSPSSSGVSESSSVPIPLTSASSSQPMTGNPTFTSLLPALQQIYLGRCRASDGRISDMVASRLRSRTPSPSSSPLISSSWSSASSASSSSVPITPPSLYHHPQVQSTSPFAKLRRIGVHFDPRQLPVSDKAYLDGIKGVELDVDMF